LLQEIVKYDEAIILIQITRATHMCTAIKLNSFIDNYTVGQELMLQKYS